MKRRVLIVILLLGILLGAAVCYICLVLRKQKFIFDKPLGRENAYNYLVNSYDSTLGLCYERPDNNTYWVTHDNVLASYALQQWNRTIADNITETVKRIAREYNLTSNTAGVPIDTRAEILLGYSVNQFNFTNPVNLNESYYGSILTTESANNSVFSDFENYTDLLCYASLIEWRQRNNVTAVYYYEKAKGMWDGNGFKDKAYSNETGYATYKLGLFYFLNRMLGKGSFEFEKELIQQIWQCQDKNGGFRTNYFGNGTLLGYTNTETTSIILLADVPSHFECGC